MKKNIFSQILADILSALNLDQAFKKKNIGKTIKMNIPFLAFAWAGNRIAEAWRMSNGDFLLFTENINYTLTHPIPSFNKIALWSGIGLAVGIKIVMIVKKKNAKKFRHNEEYGSARWGTEKDIEPYINHENKYENIILTSTESLTMEERSPYGYKYSRNKNVLVIGGSGAGKTSGFIKPNIMQMHSAYVVTDPKGTVVLECGKMLAEHGYKIKILNTINFNKSMHYNPFAYIHGEQDILILVDVIIASTKGDNEKGGEDFWVKAERLLYTALIAFIYYEMPENEHTMDTLVQLINASETREDDETFQNAVDLMFEALEKGEPEYETDENGNYVMENLVNENGEIQYEMEKGKPKLNENNEKIPIQVPKVKTDENGNVVYEKGKEPQPDHFAVRQYKRYKLAAGKTAKSILISCGARLAPFDIEGLRNIMSYDEMNLDEIGEVDKDGKKTALFIIMSDTVKTYNFVVAMLYTQLFNRLCTIADDKYGGQLPVPVRCLIDEFANIGEIPNFKTLIATIRSRRISASIILQAKSQLEDIYGKSTGTIVGCCDTILFLGGQEKSTLKEMSETLGKQTIDLFNTSENRGQSSSYGLNYNKTGRELMSQDELSVMDGGKCILQIRGTRPFFSDKFDISSHDNYKFLSDYNKANTFNVEEYVSQKIKTKKKVISDNAVIYNKDKVNEITRN